MATFEVQTRITHKYLMRKSKDALTKWVLDELDRNDALRARVQELETERDCHAEWADYYRARWLGETAVRKPDLPRAALTDKEGE